MKDGKHEAGWELNAEAQNQIAASAAGDTLHPQQRKVY